ncbi:WD40 repeat domain-containing protein [Frankia nepalensis]|nr:WD40 repeat domain-containing protein [Frankia nepalensis]
MVKTSITPQGFLLTHRPPRKLMLTAALLALVSAASMLAHWSPWNNLDSDHQAFDAEASSRQLATAASTVVDDRPALARRYAIAAYRVAPTREARIAVIDLLVPTDRPLALLRHPEEVFSLGLSPDGDLLATGDNDADVRLWTTGSRGEIDEPLATLGRHQLGDVYDGVVFGPRNTDLLATVAKNGTILLWGLAGQGLVDRPLATFKGSNVSTSNVAFSPGGEFLAVGDQTGKVWLWDTTSRGSVDRPLATLGSSSSPVNAVDFGPAGSDLLASGDDEGLVYVWRISDLDKSDRPASTLVGHLDAINNLAFSSDGRVIAAGSEDKTTMVWKIDLASKANSPVATLGHNDTVDYVAFTPAGADLLATGSSDGTVRLWDGNGWGLLASLGGASTLYDPVFSPDGSLIATVSPDGGVRLWDSSSRGQIDRPLAVLVHGKAVYDAEFTSDGGLLATGNPTGARLWELDTTRIVAGACADPVNNLTEAEWRIVLPDTPYDPPCE